MAYMEKYHQYTPEELKERRENELNPLCAPVIINGIDTGYMISQFGALYNPRGVQLRGSINNSGYMLYSISYHGKSIRVPAHRLVAFAFVPNPDPEHKTDVNHRNANRIDNWYKNLEWVTKSENMMYTSYHTEDDARKACELLEQGYSVPEVAKMSGVDRMFVYQVLKGRRCQNVSKDYNLIDRTQERRYPDEVIHKVCMYLEEGRTAKWISEHVDGVPEWLPPTIRYGNYSHVSKNYNIPPADHRNTNRKMSDETVHKICRLMEYNVTDREISKIFPEASETMLYCIRANKSYREISKLYTIPELKRIKSVYTGMVERLGVGYDYDKVIAALAKSAQ